MNPVFFKVAVVVSLITLIGCSKKSSEFQSNVPGSVAELVGAPLDLNTAIIQTPPSPLSVNAPVEVEFREPVVPEHRSGVIMDKSPFEFKPVIKGQASWVGTRRLRFQPADVLPAGISFQATLKGSIAFGSNRKVNDFTFSFKTAEQEIIGFQGDIVPDSCGKDMVRFKGTLTFAQKVDPVQVSRELKCKGPKGALTFSLTSSEPASTTLSLITEPLKRGTKGYSVTFSLPEKYTVGNEEWKKEAYIPESNLFKVLAHMDMSESDAQQRVYGFRFTDPVKTDMDLSGYITITPETNYTVSVDNKYLKVKGNFLPGAEYSITIKSGFPSAMNTTLADQYQTSFQFSNLKPELKWISDGIILPSSNSYKLQFKSVNISEVHIDVVEIYNNNIGFFIQHNVLEVSKSNSNGYSEYDYESEEYYGGNSGFQDLDRVGKSIYTKDLSLTTETNKWINSELDLSALFKGKRNSAYVITLRFAKSDLCGTCITERNQVTAGNLYYEGEDYYSNPCMDGYYYRNGTYNKVLLATDVALTCKRARDGIHVFATNIVDAKPASGIVLGAYTFQNQLLEKQTTNGQGHALLSNINEVSYIRGDGENSLALYQISHSPWEMNTFDVGGADEGEGGLNVFTYTERGVHRPGDTVHLSCIIRNSRENPSPDQPVLISVYNPQNQKKFEQKDKCGPNGLVHFAIPTETSDPTGDWRAEIEIGGKKVYHTLKIEMVKPNRFKVKIDIPDTVKTTHNISGSVNAKYLFGTPASNCDAKLDILLESKEFSPPGWTEFIFKHPMLSFSEQKVNGFEESLDDEGNRSFSTEIPEDSKIPSLISGTAIATVYEPGGGFTRQSKKITVVPYNGFVGIKPSFRYGEARTGEKYSLPVVCIDVRGKPVSGHKIKISHYFNRNYWWYDYNYSSRRSDRDFRRLETTYLVEEKTTFSSSEPQNYDIEVEDYGNHLIEITDETSGHTSGIFFWASSWGYESTKQKKIPDRNTLTIASNKNIYSPGDNVELSFPTPPSGMAIATLEVSDRILAQQVVTFSGKENTTVSFNVTDAMVPNCYAVISLIQPHKVSNDVPIRIFGVKTLQVEDLASHLPLNVKAPEQIRPGHEFSVQVSSESKSAATYTLAIVDEGLLDLTNFQTPDPWAFYYQKLRLAVATSDNFDDIIQALLPDMDRFFSIGGSEGVEQRSGDQRAQRFKPVVLFAGPVTIQPGKTESHTFKMPNYFGSVRLMLVGCSGKSFTSVEETIPVKQELIVLPTVPRVSRPLDIFAVPVSIFSLDPAVKKVTVSINVSKELSVVGPSSLTMEFEKPSEKDSLFEVKTGSVIGAAEIKINAKSGTYSAFDNITLPLTAPNPFYIDVLDTMLTGGKQVTMKVDSIGIAGTNKARLVVSRIPDMQISKRLQDLINYPHGCIEQTTSAAFPQLSIWHIIELTSIQKQEITTNINAAINRLQSFLMPDEGFSYWPRSIWSTPHYSDWGTSYAGHFLVEAKKAGYYIPPHLYDTWLRAMVRSAKNVNRGDHRLQAYRLFVLALAEKPDQGAMNLMRENYINEMPPLARTLLAAAYHISGQKDVAKKVYQNSQTEITNYRETGGTFGSPIRDRSLIAYCLIKMDEMAMAGKILLSVTKEYRPWGWYSTQETSISLLALSTLYAKSPITGGDIPFTLAIKGLKTEKITCKTNQTTIDLNDAFGREITISTSHKDPMFISLVREGIPLEDRIKTERKNMEITRNFYDDDGNPITLEDISQGEPFWVRYQVQGTTGETIENIALSSMFPSGWEIINYRLEGLEYPEWITNFYASDGTYMDIRDDRVNWFFDLNDGGSFNCVVKINPSFKGNYRLPPISVEAMYSPDYFARLQGDKVKVK
ncbi:MAG TPA: MG2 domain-containing protein [Chitinispirillaceae bacterium]|nr:MG2 domain-containing protein [Chitinispirillaceae bacterium]